MIFFQRFFFVTIAGLVAATAACSSDTKKDAASSSQGAEAACEHINNVCASTQGFSKQDCSNSNASYAKLSAAEKAKADAIAPCVLAANSCQPAINCVSGSSNDS